MILLFLFVCFSLLFAFVASVAFGFRGFRGLWLWWLSWLVWLSWLLWLLWLLAFVASVAFGFWLWWLLAFFRGFCSFCGSWLSWLPWLLAFVASVAFASCSPLDLVCCWGGAQHPPHPPRATKSALHLRRPRLPRNQYFKVNSLAHKILTKQICILC